MTSTRPYLIRAFYEWIVDNNATPYIVVNAGADYVEVPKEYVEGGQIVLNISMMAVQGLILGPQAVEFQARFGGRAQKIYIPCYAIMAIYAKENGRGMVFAEEEGLDDQNLPGPESGSESHMDATASRSHSEGASVKPLPVKSLKEVPSIKPNVPKDNKDGDDKDGGSDGSGGGGKGKKSGDRTHLKVIK
jgi:stringent starvation protein B